MSDDQLAAIAAGQRRMPRDIADAVHVFRGQHGNDAGRGRCRRGIDAEDAGEGMRRAH